eukprot:3932935-Rhodomonas_salina.1
MRTRAATRLPRPAHAPSESAPPHIAYHAPTPAGPATAAVPDRLKRVHRQLANHMKQEMKKKKQKKARKETCPTKGTFGAIHVKQRKKKKNKKRR